MENREILKRSKKDDITPEKTALGKEKCMANREISLITFAAQNEKTTD